MLSLLFSENPIHLTSFPIMNRTERATTSLVSKHVNLFVWETRNIISEMSTISVNKQFGCVLVVALLHFAVDDPMHKSLSNDSLLTADGIADTIFSEAKSKMNDLLAQMFWVLRRGTLSSGNSRPTLTKFFLHFTTAKPQTEESPDRCVITGRSLGIFLSEEPQITHWSAATSSAGLNIRSWSICAAWWSMEGSKLLWSTRSCRTSPS